MKYYNPSQKIKLFFLFLILSAAFFISFKQRAGTFFTKHPAYKELLRYQKHATNLPAKEVMKKNFPHTKFILRDLEKINSKRKFFEKDELQTIQSSLQKLKSQSSIPMNGNKSDPFQSFRGTWQGEDRSLLISRDTVKRSDDKKLNLQYLEFRAADGKSAYGLNSFDKNGEVIISRVLDGQKETLFDRLGILVSQSKIIWITKALSGSEKLKYRISIDQVIDGILNVKSVDVDFKSQVGKIDKVNFSSYQFAKWDKN